MRRRAMMRAAHVRFLDLHQPAVNRRAALHEKASRAGE
jgi:hypothetical protein